MRRARQNIIVSHGGRHGAASRTLRPGASLTRTDLEQIPDAVLGQTTELGVDAPPAPDATTEARMVVRDRKHVTNQPPKPSAAAPPAAAPSPAPAGLDEASDDNLPPSEPSSLQMPTTKRELYLLRKSDAVSLLEQLGVSHEPGISGRQAKDLLAATLGLE